MFQLAAVLASIIASSPLKNPDSASPTPHNFGDHGVISCDGTAMMQWLARFESKKDPEDRASTGIVC